jgi:BolA protein
MYQCLDDLNATYVECIDKSSTGAGGSCDRNAMLELVVVSPRFEGIPLLQRHRMVNDCLKDLMPKIHALTIKTWTPAQHEKNNA